jgi:hypothetical protein
MMMDSRKLFNTLTALLVCLGIGLLASVYFANTALSNKSTELVELKATKLAKEQQETQLAKAKEDIGTYAELNEIAKSVVPQDKDQAKTVGEIVSLASQSGIPRLSSVAFPPSTLGGSKQVKTPQGLTQVAPVKGLPGVYSLQITVTQSNTEPVPYSSFIAFLSRLEHNRRTSQVSSINVQPDPDRPDMVSFTLVIDKFIKP